MADFNKLNVRTKSAVHSYSEAPAPKKEKPAEKPKKPQPAPAAKTPTKKGKKKYPAQRFILFKDKKNAADFRMMHEFELEMRQQDFFEMVINDYMERMGLDYRIEGPTTAQQEDDQ